MSMHHKRTWCLWKSKKSGTGHLGSGVTDSSKCELEIEPGSSKRAARALECRAISPGPLFIVLRLPLPSM